MQTNQRTVLVTGGHGFLGSHLVDLLIERGFSVRCMVRPGRSGDLFGGRPIHVVSGDLRRNEGLGEAVKGADLVFHIAGLIAARGPGEFRAVNTLGTARLASAVAAAAPGCSRFVYVSSQAAAGPSTNGQPVGEDQEPCPLTHYGESKLGGERALPAALGGRIAYTIVRPPAIYGPRDEAILPFFQAASRGFVPILDGSGRRFNLLHARDVVEGILASALSDRTADRTYFLADGVGGYSYSDLADALDAAFGTPRKRVPVADLLLDMAAVAADELAALTGRASVFGRQKAKELKARWWLSSPERAAREFGWRARIDLTDGVLDTARAYGRAGLLKGAPCR